VGVGIVHTRSITPVLLLGGRVVFVGHAAAGETEGYAAGARRWGEGFLVDPVVVGMSGLCGGW
jgi:hypothetical protein